MSSVPAPESVVRFVVELDQQVRSVLGDQLAATILHGSAALGGFVPGRSDVDVLMLVHPGDVAAEQLRRVADRIHAISQSCPGVGLELSIVSASAAARPDSRWPFLLHVATQADDAKTVFGGDRNGDPDLLMHYAACRAAGIAVTGLPPHELIGEIGRAQILEYLRGELAWAVEHADTAYGVLNACRAWQFAVTGELVSKLDGASWALDAGGPQAVINAAITAQTEAGDPPPRREADELIASVRSMLREAATN